MTGERSTPGPRTDGGDQPDTDPGAIERAAALVRESDRLVAFTGAGASTESGIPDFRSPGGLWDRYDPEDFTIQALRRDPVSYWERRLEMAEEREFDWDEVEPNPAHHAIATLARDGRLSSVITQNVDSLHQAAGNSPENVLELHGARTRAKCLGCDRELSIDVLERTLDEDPLPPTCELCGGLLKRATVSFGEALPRDVLRRARREAEACDCMLVVGSSLTVHPAASIPGVAVEDGASLVIVNLEPTGMDASADVALHGKAGDVLPAIVDRIR